MTLDELSSALDSGVPDEPRAPPLAVRRRGGRSILEWAGSPARPRAGFTDEESVLLASGIVLVVAMVVHLLLLAVQPYAFPVIRRTGCRPCCS